MLLKRSGAMSMNCSKELERRKGMSSEEKIDEEFVGRLKNLLHQVRMGGDKNSLAFVLFCEEGRSEKTCISQ
jgi:hypothetical protein